MINEYGNIEYWGTPDVMARWGCKGGSHNCISFPDITQISRAVSIACTDFGLVVLDVNGDVHFAEFSGRIDLHGDDSEDFNNVFRRSLESDEVTSRIWCNNFACVRMTNHGEVRFHYLQQVKNQYGYSWRAQLEDFDGIYDGQVQHLTLTDRELTILKADGSISAYELDKHYFMWKYQELGRPETEIVPNWTHGTVAGVFPHYDGSLNCVKQVEGDEYKIGWMPCVYRFKYDRHYGEKFGKWISPFAALGMQAVLNELQPDSVFIGERYGYNSDCFIRDMYALVNGSVLSLEVKFAKDFDFEKRTSRDGPFDHVTKQSIRAITEEEDKVFDGKKHDLEEFPPSFRVFSWVDILEQKAWWSPSRRRMISRSNWSSEIEEIGWIEPEMNRAKIIGRDAPGSYGRYDPPLYIITTSGELFLGPIHQPYQSDYKGETSSFRLAFNEQEGYYSGTQGVGWGQHIPLAEPAEWRVAPKSNASTHSSIQRLFDNEVHWGVPFKLKKTAGIWGMETKVSGVEVAFKFDTGAAITCVTQEVGNQLFNRGVIRRDNYQEVVSFRDASGNVFQEKTYLVPEIVIGNITVRNVLISVSSSPKVKTCLLGQSFLEQISSYQFNSNTGELTFFK